MVWPQELKNMGISIADVVATDFAIYYLISKACYEKYVEEFFGGWIDEFQTKMNKNAFDRETNQSCLKKIIMNDEIVGFFSLDEQPDKIEGIMIQMIEEAQNRGVGSWYLGYIVSLSQRDNKPIFLRVFKSNPAQNLYERFRFQTYDETYSHYLMRYDPT